MLASVHQLGYDRPAQLTCARVQLGKMRMQSDKMHVQFRAVRV